MLLASFSPFGLNWKKKKEQNRGKPRLPSVARPPVSFPLQSDAQSSTADLQMLLESLHLHQNLQQNMLFATDFLSPLSSSINFTL